jgi:hypothetical protein
LVRSRVEVDFRTGGRHAECNARYERIERRKREDRRTLPLSYSGWVKSFGSYTR